MGAKLDLAQAKVKTPKIALLMAGVLRMMKTNRLWSLQIPGTRRGK